MSRFKLTKVTSLKTHSDFNQHVQALGLQLPLDETIAAPKNSPFLEERIWNGRAIGNRLAVQPMEGWDGTETGGVTEAMVRRWERFGESGAKLIWGGEAMAVVPEGRANPNQLILNVSNVRAIASLRDKLVESHRKIYSQTNNLCIGFQLTHSGRFCRPEDKKTWKPRVAYRHPLLDSKFGVNKQADVLSDGEVEGLIENYVAAALLAREAGADFVDIKACHGYLLHEFLGAHTRPGPYGGTFDNRSRFLRSIIEAVQIAAPKLGIGVRLSAFDSVPYQPNPATSMETAPVEATEMENAGAGSRIGEGMPVPHQHLLPYQWGFGMCRDRPTDIDLEEPKRLLKMLSQLDVRLVNITGGSPYYTPHLLRPASYPPSDGYQLFEDPLIGVAKHLCVAAELKRTHPELLIVGSGYSYLQEFLPYVAQQQLRENAIDFVGLGRMTLSYPRQIMDAVFEGKSDRKHVCRTFSDCTTAPRNGLPSGCYPLDSFYKNTDDAQRLKEIKSRT